MNILNLGGCICEFLYGLTPRWELVFRDRYEISWAVFFYDINIWFAAWVMPLKQPTSEAYIVFGQDLAYTPEQFSLLERLLIMI